MGFKGEISADQAHRGYTVTSDDTGYASVNPLYMKYTPDEDGYFSGQQGYGYKSLEEFVNAATQMRNNSKLTSKDFDSKLATLSTCKLVTAILEAGRKSLDSGNKTFNINYDANHEPISITQE
jgi:D-galacturonate reductase